MEFLSVSFFIRVAVSLLPAAAFLFGLVFIDSYKLVRLRSVLASMLVGFSMAAVAYVANTLLQRVFSLDLVILSRYVAPVVEEMLKAVYMVYLIRAHRVGFLVDAAIYGFAIGAGFAFLENIYYLVAVQEAGLWMWIIRGFGTAMMHGAATAIVGMASKALFDAAALKRFRLFIPGVMFAVALHSLFNHFLLSPLLNTLLLLLALPVCVVLVFHQSEKTTRSWLGVGFDTDQELLALIISGDVVETRVGRYLNALKSRFPGEIIVDMLCLLRLHVELSIRAKGVLMMQEAGFRVPPDPEVRKKFEELRYLERSIGPTGLLAIDPFLHTGSRDLWQRNLLMDI